MLKTVFCAITMLCLWSAPVVADIPTVDSYLKSMDLTQVSFSGHIKYDKSNLNDVDFTYYNTAGKPFPVTMDAGRKTRERIEVDCATSSFMVRLKDLCEISGTGTIEIRGSTIHLSIDEVSALEKP